MWESTGPGPGDGTNAGGGAVGIIGGAATGSSFVSAGAGVSFLGAGAGGVLEEAGDTCGDGGRAGGGSGVETGGVFGAAAGSCGGAEGGEFLGGGTLGLEDTGLFEGGVMEVVVGAPTATWGGAVAADGVDTAS